MGNICKGARLPVSNVGNAWRRQRTEDQYDKDILKRIRRSQQALQALRHRVAAFMLVLAIATGILVQQYSVKCQASHCSVINRDGGGLGFTLLLAVEQGVLELCFVARLMLLGLAPLPDDALLTRLVLLWDSYVFVSTRVSLFLQHRTFAAPTGESVDNFLRASYYARGAAFVLVAALAVVQRRPQRVQSLMWAAVGLYAAMNGLDKVFHVAYDAVALGRLSCCGGQILPMMAALRVVLRPELRQAAQARLLGWLESRMAVRAAVAIACLIGSVRPRDAVAQGRARFRAVNAGDLSYDKLKDNTPDASLYALSAPVQLGECDAFVSHSWHDDPEAKWLAFQEWRKDFVAKEGREPLLWFDKVCIDQNNIEVDLRCLPIFLNGCSRLVMLCGVTYLGRLWCITEVFAYVHMGCDIEHIQLVPVLRESREEEDLQDILDAFESFDVRACQCFKPDDKERMIVAIQTAFGCMDTFNGVVRKISLGVASARSRARGPGSSGSGSDSPSTTLSPDASSSGSSGTSGSSSISGASDKEDSGRRARVRRADPDLGGVVAGRRRLGAGARGWRLSGLVRGRLRGDTA